MCRRGLYITLAMGSFPVGIVALSVLASRVQVVTLLLPLEVFFYISSPPFTFRNGDS